MELKDIDRVRKADRRLREQAERIERLEAVATKITPTITGMPSGSGRPTDDRWADLIDKKAEVYAAIEENNKERKVLQAELEERIRKTSVLFVCELRYVHGMTISQVADASGYDKRTVYRLLSDGRSAYYGR